ncbi:MAG: VCBS repeat-containing protein [Candidatus Kapaibacterium sp.]
MNIILTLLTLLLVVSTTIHAHPLVQDTIPQLKEWWRVDNLGFGAAFGRDDNGGMTWLDNFYNGKGALVVSSPDGVKTWQMRFPGDTTNVFTWKGKGGPWRTLDGGNPTIKTGDFNGDGATDYIDAWGNIYEGIKNGEPPKSEAQTPVRYFFPWIVSDINGDGKDDMLKPGMPGSVLFGKTNLSEIINEKMILPQLDSNNEAIVAYIVSPQEMRIICRHYYWTNNVNFPFRTVYKDGLRLVRAWWDGTSFKSEILDQFTVDTQDGTGLYWVGGLHSQPQGRYYFLCATQIASNVNNTDLTVYNLSNDKIEKLYGFRMDGIQAISSLRYGFDSIGVSSLCIRQYQASPILHIYSGNISSTLQEKANFTTVQVTTLISLPDVTGDSKPDLALSNEYDFTSANTKYRFSILTCRDTVSNVVEDQENKPPFSIQVLPPMPVMRSQAIQIKVKGAKVGNYSLLVYDAVSKRVASTTIHIPELGDNIINIDLSQFKIVNGKYTLQLEGYGRTALCSIIIQ